MSTEESPRPARRSTGARALMGLGIGCGGLLLVGVLTLAGAAYWAFAPGHQAPSARIVGPRSAGYAHLADLRDDPGAQALCGRILREATRVSSATPAAEEPGPGFDWPALLRRAAVEERELLEILLPYDATLSFEPDPGAGPRQLAALNFRRFVRPAAALIEHSAAAHPEIEHRPEAVPGGAFLFSESGWLVARDRGTLVAASAGSELGAALELLEGEGPDARTEARIEAGRSDWHLHGQLAPELLPRGGLAGKLLGAKLIEEIVFGLSIRSEDRLQGRVTIDAGGPEGAAALRPALGLMLMMAEGQASLSGMALEQELSVRDQRVVIDLDLSGLDRFIAAQGDSLIARRARQR